MVEDPVICLACRETTGEGEVTVRTLARSGDVLVCACGRRYPIIGGVPLLLADPTGYLQNETISVLDGDLPPEVTALLAVGPDTGGYTRLVDHLSTYLDAHWGDRADPPPDGFAGTTGIAALVAKISERSRVRVRTAIEIGCSAGRFVAELARGADRVYGLDLQVAIMRRTRRLLAGERVAYNRRVVGHNYRTVHVHAGDLAITGPLEDRITLLCADALDPPLVPGEFDRVVALNMVDSVPRPRELLGVLDALCAIGGEIILASPYTWSSATMAAGERIGGLDPAAGIRAAFGGAYTIEDEAELPWSLRREARVAIVYTCHYVRLRKNG